MATVVRVQPGEPVDALIRKFNKKVQNEGVLAEYRKKEYFMKHSEIRKQKEEAKRKKIAKSLRYG